MPKTFDYYRSTNSRLHAALDQEDNYSRYIKRIETIVSRKPRLDLSSSQYMSFLNKCHQRSNSHRSQEHLTQINSENQILLDKIIGAKKRKVEKLDDRYMVAMHEKRFRWQEQINQENRKIALRVIQQTSTIDSRSREPQVRESPRRSAEKTFYESRVKERKLPKLMEMRS